MDQDIALQILAVAADGTLGTRDVASATGRSPNTVVRYLRELEARGLLRRRTAGKIGVGRPRMLCEPTGAGLRFLRLGEAGTLARLERQARVAWGPVRSFTRWGVPFLGWPDLFSDRPIDAPGFEVLVERNPALYEDAEARCGARYPCLEALAAWAAGSGDPRYAAASVLLLRDPRLDPVRLRAKAVAFGSVNRVGFLATLGGARRALRDLAPSVRWERMAAGAGPADPDAERAAARWHVRNPIPRGTVDEIRRLYAGREP
jgi:hypothetical protein